MDSLKAVLGVVEPFLKRLGEIGDKQCWIFNQDVDIPKDGKLYVTAQMVTPKVYSNSVKTKEIDGKFSSEYKTSSMDMVQIDMWSKDKKTFSLIPAVVASFKAPSSIQFMTANGFRINPVPLTYGDTSSKDGYKFIYRSTITVSVFNQYGTILEEKDFYDTFDEKLYINDENNEV